jgi:hypothetical protein
MSAFDPTIEPDDTERRVAAWLADQRSEVDLTSTYASIVARSGSARQRPGLLVRARGGRMMPPTTWSYRAANVAPIVIAALLLGLAIGAGILVGSRVNVDRPAPLPVPSVPAVVDPAVEIEGNNVVGNVRYTSRLFKPKVTFTATARTVTGVDICTPPATAPRMIVLAHPMGCVQDLRFIRPWAVACGSAGDHPNASALAAAILAIPSRTAVVDLGDLAGGGEIPAGTFREPYASRVIEMRSEGTTFDQTAHDPDQCELLPEPGTRDPAIELRGDLAALLVLIDVGDELVVVRASTSGYDAASGAAAVARGYAGHDAKALRHLFSLVRDVRFGP